MAITLTTARDRVRKRTRHTNTADPRLTDAHVDDALMETYRNIRTRLQEAAPTMYLTTSTAQSVVASSPALAQASINAAYENTYRVDRHWEGEGYREVPRADPLNPNVHKGSALTWREEGGSILFGPDNDEIITGTYQVIFWITPADITNPANPFLIPAGLESALIAGACSIVAINDGDAKAQDMFDRRYEALWKAALPSLSGRHGVHQRDAGFRRVLPY